MYEAHEETKRFMDVRNRLRRSTKTQQTNPRPREKTTSFCGSRILSRASWRVACPGTIYAVLTRARCASRAWERHVRRLPRARRERPCRRAAEQRDELAASQLIELHSVPSPSRDALTKV